ncbi:hypothetical protein ALC53_08510 [Atta colombica]|uniref:NADH:ubiquinone reductase (H(+)-translocating) n=1 Tax=Atta colombica TaxID=520822 RepID=A0A195BAB1_9HYME|nr:hypothetical protein ALC53_08510 [Atta colombica]
MGISTSSLAVFHWFLPAASATTVLMEGWELTPRGLPVLLSLFMSDDIATLLAFANPQSAVNTSREMRSASVILLLPVP